jgi:hypothetical protein
MPAAASQLQRFKSAVGLTLAMVKLWPLEGSAHPIISRCKMEAKFVFNIKFHKPNAIFTIFAAKKKLRCRPCGSQLLAYNAHTVAIASVVCA